MRISLRPVLIGLIVLVGVLGLTKVVPTEEPKTAAFVGACNREHPGVSLVVDFGANSGRAPLIKCATFGKGNPIAPALNGWQIFGAAGVALEGTSEFPVGFVCRIEGFPSKAQQSCQKTPSYSDGHWAYFYATASVDNASWVFSMTGSTNRKPTCGSAEGWLFVTETPQVEGGQVKAATGGPSPKPPVFRCAP